MPLTTGKDGVSSGKGPKGEILRPEELSRLPVTSNTKGFLPLPGRVPNTGFLPQQTQDLPPTLQQTKGQNLHPQGKAPNSMAPQLAPKQFMQGPGSYKPSKAYKPVAPVVPQAIPIHQENSPQTSQTVALEHLQVLSQEQNRSPVVPESAQSTPEMQQTKIQSNQALSQTKNPTTNPGKPHSFEVKSFLKLYNSLKLHPF